MKSQRKKGKDFENAVAAAMRAAGFPSALRGAPAQARCSGECPDIIGGPVDFWPECQHAHYADPWAKLAQADAAIGPWLTGFKRPVPVAITRGGKSRPPIASLYLPSFLHLAKELEDLRAKNAHLAAALAEASDAKLAAAPAPEVA